ncbi:hypothetical protein [Zunongwangia endophytica]|uniref:SAP domain-containing protein n=1 Tax=Zunongwangia endophytica TaxID=1808945 RepID=A0ABV8H5M5_9FLAO|nr:hypothetical protein [Zunongwangia endophytica]MDN3595311.1 hypothetical protein [Zunongwangia endophytica]
MNKKELKARCKELGISTEGLDTNAKLEEAIQDKEAELAAKAEAEEKSDKLDLDSEESDAKTGENDTKSTEAVPDNTESETSEDYPETQKESTKSGEDLNEDSAPDHYEDDRGRKWKFKANTPKKLRIDGHPMSQEEILGTEEVISELVLGNCSFLTQIIE